MSGNTVGGLSSGNRSLNGLTDTGSTATLTVGDELKLKTTSKIIIEGATLPSGSAGDVIMRDEGEGIKWAAQFNTVGVNITDTNEYTQLYPTFVAQSDVSNVITSNLRKIHTAKNTIILDPSNAIFDISNVALRIPRGTSDARPTAETEADVGYIRYNTQLNQFEGFGAGPAWGSLGGVKDIDADTYITAESTPDSDKLQFYTASAERMVIDPTGKVGIGTTNPNHKLDVAGKIKAVALEIDKWVLVTELNRDDPMNNPWNGTKETGAPTVLVPLNTLSSSAGKDLEIKIEWDNNDGTTSHRFYKGWPLDVVFDYTRTAPTNELGYSVYAKWNENDNWYESPTTQWVGAGNENWNWNFNADHYDNPYEHTDTMSGKIGYRNVGLIIHGTGGTETLYNIYAGGDGKAENSTYGGKNIYNNYTAFSKVRVYVAGALTVGGKVGIGTTAPQTSLQIYKDVATGRDEVFRLTTNTGGGCGPLMRFTSYHTSGDNPSIDEYNLAGIAGYDSTGNWGGSLTFSTAPEGDHGGSNLIERMTINDQGNVGIGTTDPKENLEISGDTARLRIHDVTTSRNPGIEFVRGSTTFGGDEYSDWRIHNDGGKLKFYTKNDGSDGGIDGDVMSLKYNGNVGIGTTNPGAKLEIIETDICNNGIAYPLILDHRLSSGTPDEGIGTGIYFRCQRDTGANAHDARKIASIEGYGAANIPGTNDQWNLRFKVRDNDTIKTPLVLKHDGNVGIGTDNPNANLQVHQTTAPSIEENSYNDGLVLSYDGGYNEGDLGPGISFAQRWHNGTDGFVKTGAIHGYKGTANGNFGGGLQFYSINGSSGLIERMRIDNIGKVGIGTTYPQTSLDINGDGTNCLTLRNGNSSTGDSKSHILLSYNGNAYNSGEGLGASLGGYSHKIQSRHQSGTAHTQNAIDFYLWKNGQGPHEIGNTHGMSITAGGVGIGTTDPKTNLQIGNTSDKTSNTILTLASDGGNAYKQGIRMIHHGGAPGTGTDGIQHGWYIFGDDHDDKLHIGHYDGNSTEIDNIVINKPNGDVSIANALTVGGTITGNLSANITGNLTVSGADSWFGSEAAGVHLGVKEVKFRGDGDTHFSIMRDGKNLDIRNTGNQAAIGYAGDTLLRIKHTGEVGIGTTNPAAKLQVEGTIKAETLEIGTWILVTELNKDDPMNNPWNGTKETGAPTVLVPLNTISSSNGTDLEIKIEWVHNDGKVSNRFYKGWRLDYVFDYKLGGGSGVTQPGSNITVYAKWNEDDDWYLSNQRIYANNGNCNWNFQEGHASSLNHTQTLSGKIGYYNVGFILHGYSNNEQAYSIYSGGDEHGGNQHGRWNNYTGFSKVRVYARREIHSVGSASMTGDLTVGGTITASNSLPIGSVIAWHNKDGVDPPTNWALCDGGTYGGYETPNLTGRFILGVGGGKNLNEKGGEEMVTLSVPQMPSHTHTALAAGGQDATDTGNGGAQAERTTGDGGHRPATTTGDGGAHTPTINGNAGAHKHWMDRMPHDDRNLTGTGASWQEYGLVADAGSYNTNTANTGHPGKWTSQNGNHTHTIDEVPSHTHTIPAIPNHTHTIPAIPNHTHTIPAIPDHTHNTDATGGGGSHNNMPPYYVLVYIIKIA